jgi:Flp pilus assembly protein CpaB
MEVHWEGRIFWATPGDRFDLVLERKTPDGPRAELLLEGVRVSAVGRQTGNSSVVTFPVTLAQVERLSAARRRGRVVPVLWPTP